MRILALDTTTHACTVAITDDGNLLTEITVQMPRAHSARLMPLISQAVAESRIATHELDAVAVGIGPGSFTGLRIGVATARGLAWALGKPCMGISTLKAMAYGTGAQAGLAVSMLDAKRGEVYAAIYRVGNRNPSTWIEVMPPAHIGIQRLGEQVRIVRAELHHTWQFVTLCGDVAERYQPDLQLGEVAMLAPSNALLPRAWAVAELAYAQRSDGQISDESPLPVYLKKSEAEALWEARKSPSSL